jgi:hypothetical protein
MARSKAVARKTPAAAKAAERAAEHWTSRQLPLLAPPAGFAMLAGVIAVMHRYWGGSPVRTPLWATAIALLGTAASAYAWIAAGGHRHHLRGLSVLTTAAATLAAVAGMVVGLMPVLGPYVLGAAFLSVLWGIRHAMKSADEGGGSPLGKLGEHIDAERHHIFAMRRSGKGTVQATVKAQPGATIEEFQQHLPVLGAAAGVPRGGAVLRPDDDDSSTGHLEITVADLLKDPIPYPGPARVGALCTAPIPVGLYSTGDVVEAQVLTKDGDIEHLLIVGVTGSGKSEFCLVYLGGLLVRRRVNTIGVDCSKWLQTFGPVVHGMDLVITDFRTAHKFLAVMPKVIRDRTEYLASEGMNKWAPKTPDGRRTKINLLKVWIEEAADLAEAGRYAEMLRRARSAGIEIVSSLQRAAWDEMDTNARANHGGGMAFGCRDTEDVLFALPAEVVEAGASPLWRNRKPGYAYLAGLNTDPDNWHRVMRGYLLGTEGRRALAAAVTAAAAVRDPLDEITANALGPIWQQRTVYTQPAGLPALPGQARPAVQLTQPGSHAGRVVVPGPWAAPAAITSDAPGSDDTDEDTDMEEIELTDAQHAELDEAREEILGPLDRARREEIDAAGARPWELPDGGDGGNYDYDDDTDDLDQPISDTSDVEMTFEAEADVTAAEARAMLDAQLDAWLRDGKDEFAPKDLYPLLERLGRGRRWFYHARDDLEAAGVIAEAGDIGVYHILRSPRTEATV